MSSVMFRNSRSDWRNDTINVACIDSMGDDSPYVCNALLNKGENHPFSIPLAPGLAKKYAPCETNIHLTTIMRLGSTQGCLWPVFLLHFFQDPLKNGRLRLHLLLRPGLPVGVLDARKMPSRQRPANTAQPCRPALHLRQLGVP